MKNQYNINDDVEVRFYGKITEIYCVNDKIYYAVNAGKMLEMKANARTLSENQIFTLPTENMEVKE